MSSNALFRLSGLAGILCGLFIIIDTLFIELFLPLNALTNSVGQFAVILALLVLTGMYLWQRPASGLLGDIGYLVNFIGLVLLIGVAFAGNYILPYLDQSATQELFAGPTRFVFLISALVFLAGVVLFGLAIFRARVFPQPAAIMYMIGFALYSLSPFLPDAIVRIAQVTGSLAVMWFGYALLIKTMSMESRSMISPSAT
jgi:hypothetical protein